VGSAQHFLIKPTVFCGFFSVFCCDGKKKVVWREKKLKVLKSARISNAGSFQKADFKQNFSKST